MARRAVRWRRFSVRALLVLTALVALVVFDVQRHVVSERAAERLEEEYPGCSISYREATTIGQWRSRLAGLFGVKLDSLQISFLELKADVDAGETNFTPAQLKLLSQLSPVASLSIEGFEFSLVDLQAIPKRHANFGLYLDFCTLKHSSLRDLNLPQLESLHLSYCDDIEDIDAIGELFPKLKWLSLRSIAVKNIPRSIRSCNQLELLSLSGPEITDDAVEGIEHIRSLTTLDIRDSPVTDKPLRHLDELTLLTHVWFEETKITGATFSLVANAPNLRRLGIRQSDVLTDEDLAPLHDNTQLRDLMIDTCPKITDQSADVLGSLTNLETLWIHDTQISRATVKKVAQLRRLKDLRLNADAFLLDDLLPLAQNDWLTIAYFKLLDSGMLDGGSLRKDDLQELMGIAQYGSSSNLEWLHGLHADHLKRLPATITEINLRGSELSADIIEAVADRPETRSLNLSHCNVDAAMLAPLAKLKKLEHLDLRSCPNIGEDIDGLINQLPPTCDVTLK